MRFSAAETTAQAHADVNYGLVPTGNVSVTVVHVHLKEGVYVAPVRLIERRLFMMKRTVGMFTTKTSCCVNLTKTGLLKCRKRVILTEITQNGTSQKQNNTPR